MGLLVLYFESLFDLVVLTPTASGIDYPKCVPGLGESREREGESVADFWRSILL